MKPEDFQKLKTSGIILAAAAGAVWLYAHDPASSGFLPPCPFHWLTGLYCPGCGSLRTTHHLLHGDVGAAFRFNPLLVLSLPVLGVMALRPSWFRGAWVAWFWLAVLVAYGILRNIPVWPFSLIAPG